ncbi:hypothetical protein PABG_03437 [Paracoccidioides brasiliensis Pb03]|nr:hypothetical protein PABG_03437 [Paracoccidioides brasiliensis Pb03]
MYAWPAKGNSRLHSDQAASLPYYFSGGLESETGERKEREVVGDIQGNNSGFGPCWETGTKPMPQPTADGGTTEKPQEGVEGPTRVEIVEIEYSMVGERREREERNGWKKPVQ